MNYELISTGTNEWAVKVQGAIAPCGTIRLLTHCTYGWHDITGYHEYLSREDAAIECINSARKRRIRQGSRANLGKYVRQKVSA
jgi:hypothetical protein